MTRESEADRRVRQDRVMGAERNDAEGAVWGGGGDGDHTSDYQRRLVNIQTIWAGIGLVTVAWERRNYQRPRLAMGALGITLAGQAWAQWRARSGRPARSDRRGAVVSELVGTAALLAVTNAADPDEQFGGLVDWAFQSMLWRSALVPFALDDRVVGLAMVGGSTVGYVGAVTHRTGWSGFGRAAANGMQFVGFFAAGHAFATNLRRGHRAVEIAQREALTAAVRAEVERTRTEAMGDLHGRSLDVMREIRDLWSVDPERARAAARREAVRLRQSLLAHGSDLTASTQVAPEGPVREGADLMQGVAAELALAASDVGLRCEVTTDLRQGVSPASSLAIRDAAIDALGWLSAHATERRCVLRIVTGDDDVEVLLRSHGVERDVEGDELALRLSQRVERVVGSAQVRVARQSGARIAIRVPL